MTYRRATAVLLALALCWPMATAFAAAAASPARPACCMRMSHTCHSQMEQPGDKFESVCRTCGWCHAVPNARARLNTTSVIFATYITEFTLDHESQSQPTLAVSRLHASRAPPLPLR